MLQQPFELLYERIEPFPSCIIADKSLAWAADTTRKFRVRRIIFDGMSCFTLLAAHNLYISRVYESFPETEPFVVPGLPDRIELTRAQLPASFNPGLLDMQSFRERVKEAEEEAYGVVINSFELEPKYVEEFRKLKGDKVRCIGPLSLCNKDNLDKAQRGNKPAVDENQCLKWLDSQEPCSVLYACFGSISRVLAPQLIELGLGLEGSKGPFVWIIRGGEKVKKEMEKWIEEDGFEERTKGRGLIIRGWAPQLLILSHPAVGAFLTHSGWNSTLEGVCAGDPMITWPSFAEQFFNEKLVVQVFEIGVGVGARVVVHLGEEEYNSGVLVKSEAVVKAVEEIMEEGIEEGEERRKRARVLGEMARRAMEEGGSSDLNMKLLIQDIMQQIDLDSSS